MQTSLASHLTSSPLFSTLDDDLLAQLEPDLELVTLAAGDVLMRQGEVGDAMYTLLSGELAVRVATSEGSGLTVDRITPTASVGEMALLTGHKRSATLTATQASTLVKLSQQAFNRIAAGLPELYETVMTAMTPRLQRIQLSGVLERWFDALDDKEVHALQDAVEWVRLPAGQRLYNEGDEPDGMFLLINGRLRMLRLTSEGKEQHVADVSHGESVGEYAVIGNAPRAESVVARRDSQLVKLSRELVAEHPRVMAQIARVVLERARSNLGERPAGNGVRTLALVSAGEEAMTEAVAARLTPHLRAWGRLTRVDAEALNKALGRKDAAQVEQGSLFEPALAHYLDDLELDHDFLVFATDPTLTPWTLRCLRQADVVLVVAAADGDPQPGPVEAEVARLDGADLQLVLVHPDEAERPKGTARWLEKRSVSHFHHLRLGNDDDVARLARRVTGRANALVFSGGGARGYVHIGLIRALEEAKIPIDIIAGTSMGALMSAGYALKHDYDFIYESAVAFGDPRKLLDRTLPLVALNESKAVTKLFQHLFGDARIEDLWTPFFCVSSNLTRAEPVVHETGPLWEAVRASTAIPGVFTPIVYQGDVVVDGGVMNNFPVDIMRNKVGTGVVIGSNAYAQSSNDKPYDFGPSISGRQALLQKFLPRSRRKSYPSLIGTLMRATSLSSKYMSEYADSFTDLLIRYPTGDYSSLEFDRYNELIDIGYKAGREAVADWLEAAQPPKRKAKV